MRCVHKENGVLAGDGLFQLGLQFLLQEFPLDIWVCLGRNGSHFSWLHANMFEEISNLGRFAIDPGQLGNLRRGVRDSRWRILQKKSFTVP